MVENKLKKGEWFISGEHGINKFKHGIKTFFLFIVLPIIFFHLLISYFLLPFIFTEQFKIINSAFEVVFRNFPINIINNFDLFSTAFVQMMKYFFIFSLCISPLYIFLGKKIYKKIKASSKNMIQEKFIKGAKFLTKREIIIEQAETTLRLENLKELNDEELEKKINKFSNFSLAGVPFLKALETAHVMIPGSSRKGKTQLFRNVLFKAKEMSNKNVRMARGLITDEKGELLSKTFSSENGDFIFNPADERSLKWTIFNDIRDIIDIENFTVWLIPSNNESDTFWISSAREILKNMLLYLFISNRKTNKDFADLLDLGRENIIELFKEKLPPKMAEYLQKEDSWKTFQLYTNFFYYAQDGDFSINKWVKEAEYGFIYITINLRTKEIFKPLLTLFVNTFGTEIMNLKDNPDARTYMFLEEFTSLNKLPILIDILKLAGSKGLSVWLIFQDYSLIEKIYSKEEKDSIINNCSTLICLGLNEVEACKYFSGKLGEKVTQEYQMNHSMGIAENRDGLSLNEQKKTEDLVSPTDILYLPAFNCFMKIANVPGVIKLEFPLIKDVAIVEDFIESPFLSNFINNMMDVFEEKKELARLEELRKQLEIDDKKEKLKQLKEQRADEIEENKLLEISNEIAEIEEYMEEIKMTNNEKEVIKKKPRNLSSLMEGL